MFPNNSDVVSLQQGYGVLIGTVIIFNILNRIVTFIGVPAVVIHYAINKEEEKWKWRNLVLSWIHAFFVGVWNISCFYFYPEIWDDLITHITPYTYYMVAVSTGYFIYDFGDILAQGKALEMWQLTLHHIAVGSNFFYNLSMRYCIGYNVVAMMAEINSFFLHSRKLMQMRRFPFDHWLYRANAVVNLGSFFFCRGFSLSLILYGMWAEPERVDRIYFFTLMFSMFVMTAINPILFCILLRNDFLRKDYTDSKKVVENGDSAVRNGQPVVIKKLLDVDSDKID